MPVSAERCCDWKNTASGSRQLGHSLFDRGSCHVGNVSAKSAQGIFIALWGLGDKEKPLCPLRLPSASPYSVP